MQNDTRIAVDVAKAVFEIAISDCPGRIVRRERLPRAQFLTFFAQQPAATVVMRPVAPHTTGAVASNSSTVSGRGPGAAFVKPVPT